MAAPASLAFVTGGPSTTPTIALNLVQPGLIGVLNDFTLGAPEFEGDPGSVGAGYGERTVEFTLQFTGTYAEAAAAVQLVTRQITQPNAAQDNRNWLMFKWAGDPNTFFARTFPTSLDGLDWSQSGVGVWEMPVRLRCDGFMWGAPEDIASQTVTNSPVSGTNKMMLTLPTVKGDVETPLLLAQTTGPGISTDQGSAIGYLSSYAVGGGQTHAFLARSLSELTSGTDMGANVTGAGSNYVDGDYKSCAFTDTSLKTRLSGSFTTALSPMPGTYRLLLRIVTPSGLGTIGAGTMNFIVYVRTDGSSALLPLSNMTPTLSWNNAADTAFLLDFGVVQLPPGAPTGPVGLAPPTSTGTAPYWNISVSQLGVVGAPKAVRFDELILLPVETTYGVAQSALVDFPTYSASLPNNVIAYDGVNDEMRTLFDAGGTAPFSGLPTTATDMNWQGGLPTVRPGYNNYLQFLYNATLTTGTTAFTMRYYPKYVHVRPATT